MEITHKLEKDNNIYIYVDIIDEVEFSKEFLNKEDNSSFILKLKNYVKKNFDSNNMAILVINGVLIGTMSLAMFFTPIIESKEVGDNEIKPINETHISLIQEDELKNKVAIIPEEPAENIEKNMEIKPVKNLSRPQKNNLPKKETLKEETLPITNDITIKLKTNGTVINIPLEEYVIGVVAAEMPASFNLEALKAQAVATRTFAMKKVTSKITLLDSTSHQVYKDKNEQKSMWGKSYDIYYNKIRNAVYDTKGVVLKYNGNYIDALYHSISNGKTELPKYVWGNNLSYLQSVNSNWDKNVNGYEKTVKFTYSFLNSKLGTNINSSSNIKINSYTASNRVDSVTIGNKTFSGVTLRSKLSLRSADFVIEKTDLGLDITTRGYGHGVGMSQYRGK